MDCTCIEPSLMSLTNSWNQDTSMKWTPEIVPRVSRLERLYIVRSWTSLINAGLLLCCLRCCQRCQLSLLNHWELSSILLFSYDTSSGIKTLSLPDIQCILHVCSACMCSFCNQSHTLWPQCWLLTQPQHLPSTWYISYCLISLIMDTELYQHMCNCFTSTLQGGFHAVVFHCIIKFWV